MDRPATRLLARLAPLVSAAVLGACGGQTNDGVGEITNGGGGASGSTAGTGGSNAGTGGSNAGTGGSTAGTGGSTAGTGGSSAGTGGSTAGTGGSTAGTGGSTAGAAGAGGACVVPNGCGDVCYARAVGETCLPYTGNVDPALFDRLGCTGDVWTSSEPTADTCCYLMGQCGVGRPITIAGVAVTATLLVGEGAAWR
jgi:hypothetical protein